MYVKTGTCDPSRLFEIFRDFFVCAMQPLHIILKPSSDPDFQEELLKDKEGKYFQPRAYKDANNIDNYKKWLEQGLNDFYSE